jgi:GTP cyclohydrolase I
MNQALVEEHIYLMLKDGLGFDMTDPNLIDTPKRIAKMYCKELFHAVNKEFPEKEFSKFPNTEKYNQITMLDNIHFTSVCSHHFLPFTGKAWFLYIPGDFDMSNESDLIGASKPARIIAHYAARPQLQENLCHQVMNRFVEVMQPKGAMLVMRAIHGCMSCRGVRQYNNTGMTSSAVYGAFNEPATRAEAMQLIQLSLAPL